MSEQGSSAVDLAKFDADRDPFGAVLDPLSASTRRWAAVLWIVAVAGFLVSESTTAPVKVSIASVATFEMQRADAKWVCTVALVALCVILAITALADLIAARHRWERARRKAHAAEGTGKKPPEQRFRDFLLEKPVAVAVMLPIVVHLVVGLGAAVVITVKP